MERRKSYYIFLLILTLLFSVPENARSESDEQIRIESISGVLLRIDENKQALFIRSDSRIVKFYTNLEICEEFARSINSAVYVTFIRKKTEGLHLLTIILIHKEDVSEIYEEAPSVKK